MHLPINLLYILRCISRINFKRIRISHQFHLRCVKNMCPEMHLWMLGALVTFHSSGGAHIRVEISFPKTNGLTDTLEIVCSPYMIEDLFIHIISSSSRGIILKKYTLLNYFEKCFFLTLSHPIFRWINIWVSHLGEDTCNIIKHSKRI